MSPGTSEEPCKGGTRTKTLSPKALVEDTVSGRGLPSDEEEAVSRGKSVSLRRGQSRSLKRVVASVVETKSEGRPLSTVVSGALCPGVRGGGGRKVEWRVYGGSRSSELYTWSGKVEGRVLGDRQRVVSYL